MNRKTKRRLFILICSGLLLLSGFWASRRLNLFRNYHVGQAIDSLNGVKVYYNGHVANIEGRNTSPDNYNLGLKYQCVEFVKRYYYEHLKHKMPDSYGHAVDFFDKKLRDGEKNKRRALIQYSNPGKAKPEPDDLLIFAGHGGNPYGHVAIVSKLTENNIEIIQQNPGPMGRSRVNFALLKSGGKWKIDNERILGWLRKE